MPQLPFQFTYAGWLVGYLALTYVLTDVLKLEGRTQYLVRTLLTAAGLIGYGCFVWFRMKKEKAQKAADAAAGAVPGAMPAEVAEDLDALMRDAEGRLQTSRLGKDARIGTLPVVVVMGERGAAKTSTVLACGAEPELLAGHVYQEGYVVPTRAANLWFARGAVVLESGGQLQEQGGRWTSFVRSMRPARLRGLFKKATQAPRAAVVCVDAEAFLQPGAQENMTQLARRLHQRLRELAETLAIHLPVYTLFTRCDRVPFFQEYLGNFSDDEAQQAVGTTLAMIPGHRAGVYAEEESRRLTSAFHELFLGLCDFRPVYLGREHDSRKLAGIYEFPREFRKLRALAVNFLVELCRPSQLQAGPLLRGFYFSGVRPVEVREVVQAPHARQAQGGEATSYFALQRDRSDREAFGAQQVTTRRVPQWVWLSRLFNDVILRDAAAVTMSAQGAGLDASRRFLLIGGTALALILGALFTVSYAKNRALEKTVREAAVGIGAATGTANQLASLDSLKRLETLRLQLAQLVEWEREGPPPAYTMGLYVGDKMLDTARKIYFGKFHQVMFGSTQQGLLDWLRRLPPQPGPSDEYQPTYDTLKAYLITTSRHEKSTKLFLGPVLTARWAGSNQVDNERRTLAQRQFEFYAEELKIRNMFSSEEDSLAIERARKYLNAFGAADRIYAFLVAEANRQHKSVQFNRDVPQSNQAILSEKEVAGAFTKAGSAWMIKNIGEFERFFAGEEWVLGKQAAMDPAKIIPELMARYQREFLGNWREYLRTSRVQPYANVTDAARKLGLLSNPSSYLLNLICLASVNTAEARDDLKAPFQPVQFTTPPGCLDKFISQPNQEYVSGLLALRSALEQFASQMPQAGDPRISSTLQEAARAKNLARQVATNFRPDKEAPANEGKVEAQTERLLLEPIIYVENLLGRLGPQQLNGAGRSFCIDSFDRLMKKYPFNTNSQIDATLDEVSGVFRPETGSLWVFYKTNLVNYLQRQGAQFELVPGAPGGVRITSSFLSFFNRAVAFSDALYKGTAQEPSITYTMRALPGEGYRSTTLRLDGQTLKSPASGGSQQTFRWPGSGTREVRTFIDSGLGDIGWLDFNGVWAVFRFFGDTERFDRDGSGYTLEWYNRSGQSRQPARLNDKPISFRFRLDLGGAPPIFQKGWLAGFNCVSSVAQ